MLKKKTYIVCQYDDLDQPRAKVKVRAWTPHQARKLAREYLDDDLLEVIEITDHEN